MTERSLQVTYRKGRMLAAYLHLSHRTITSFDDLRELLAQGDSRRGAVDMGAKRVLQQSHMTSGSSHRAGLSASTLTDKRGGHIAPD